MKQKMARVLNTRVSSGNAKTFIRQDGNTRESSGEFVLVQRMSVQILLVSVNVDELSHV